MTGSWPRRACTADGCRAPHYARGLCKPHYDAARHRARYEPRPRPPRPPRPVTPPPVNRARQDLEHRGRLPAFYRKSTG